MTDNGFNKEQLLELISGLLEGGLDDAGRATLNALLKENPEARRIYRWHMRLHTRLHLDYAAAQLPAHMPHFVSPTRPARFPRRRAVPVAMAACIAILAAIGWTRFQKTDHFATVEHVRGSRWDSGDLPTASGARIGRGTLRLVEGMATIRFDSGVKLTLEAPADLKLVDAMHCTLNRGTAVADVPETAIGFRIATPSAKVVDYGTRFAVVVDATSGSTRTQVYEGLVTVEERLSGKITSLTTGQTNATATSPLSPEPAIIGPPGRTPDWILLAPTKDAYIGQAYVDHATSGRVEIHRSETLLLLKNGTVHRKAYLGYDLPGIDPASIKEAELTLHFAPTNWGVASIVPDATFSVFGLVTDQPWEEKAIDEKIAPAHQIQLRPSMRTPAESPWLDESKVRKLGSFQVRQGVQSGTFGIAGDALVAFLREHAGSGITLIVVRDTPERETNGLVHGIASRRHPTLKPPTLAIRLAQP